MDYIFSKLIIKVDIKTALRNTAISLASRGIEQFNLEARILVSYSLSVAEEYLFINPDQELSKKELETLEISIKRRMNFEPISYITGKKEFYSRNFYVNKDVLIPRADSEVLIDAVCSTQKPSPKILELGTGSGCLIITLMLQLPLATAYAIDIKKEALEVAKKNAQLHNVNVGFLVSDWFSSIAHQDFDIIISNPPYIDKSSNKVSKETYLYEPSTALFALDEGLKCYKTIASNISKYLSEDGELYLEIGYDQEENVTKIYEMSGFSLVGRYLDISGITRCLKFERSKQ